MPRPVLDGAHAMGADPFAAFQRSPLTFARFGLLVAYYVAYCTGILPGEARAPEPAPFDAAPSRGPDAWRA